MNDFIEGQSSRRNDMKIGLIPYGFKGLRGLPMLQTSDIDWLTETPPTLPDLVEDLDDSYILVLFSSTRTWIEPRGKIRCKLAVFIAEPASIQYLSHNLWPKIFNKKFELILSWNPTLSCQYDNCLYTPFADTEINFRSKPDFHQTKPKKCVIVASSKNSTLGHKLRHKIISQKSDIGIEFDTYGRGYRPFDKKEDLYAQYYASIVIENSREPSYFTEKLTDTILSGLVPIYWGASNISDFFDETGLIRFSSIEDLSCNAEYINRIDFSYRAKEREDNYYAALKHLDHKLVIKHKILAFLNRAHQRIGSPRE